MATWVAAAARRSHARGSARLLFAHPPSMSGSLRVVTPQALPNACPIIVRCESSSSDAATPQPPDYLSDGERHIFTKLRNELQPTKLEVQDISGGCGSMYGLDIVSPKFAGLSVIKQHKLVNQVLAEELKQWHGVQLKTKAPE